MFFALYSNNKDYDEVYIQNYAKLTWFQNYNV
jgi:hypothetical protein